MFSRSLVAPAGLGTLVTTGLLLVPFPYSFAPVVGGTIAILVARERSQDWLRTGLLVAFGMIPGGVALTVLLLFFPEVVANSGAAEMVRSMRGMGPQNAIFFGVFVYFLVIYTGLCTLLVSVIGAAFDRLVDQRFLDRRG